jgi:transaldolase
MPTATEEQIAWKIVEEGSINGAELLLPVFKQHLGVNGRLSIQTDPRFFRDSKAILAQAVRFNALAPNMIVKIPAAQDGISAIEEATYLGISIDATVCFTLPRCVAVAEAVERGFKRRESEGKAVSDMGPALTTNEGFRLRNLIPSEQHPELFASFVPPAMSWRQSYAIG